MGMWNGFSIKKGDGTHALVSIISVGNIVAYMAIYHEMKDIKIRPYIDLDPEREVNAIKRNLKKLCRRGFVNNGDLKQFISTLYNTMAATEIGQESLASFGIKKQGPASRALNVLIFALVFDCRYHSKKPQYKLIADFLREQHIAHFSDEEVRKRFARIKEETARECLKSYLIASNQLCSMLSEILNSDNIRAGFLTPDVLQIISNLST